MAGTAQRVIKNTGYLYAKMGVTMFISLYVTRLILNSLGAADFGIYNIVGGAIGMLGFLNAAMAGATQRFLSYAEGEGDKEKQKSIFNVSVVLHLLIAFVMLAAFVVAGYFFFDGILNIPPGRVAAAKVVYASLIVSTLFTIANVPYDAVMNAHENMRYYAIVGIAESLLKLAVAFACVYAPGDKLIVYGMLMAVIPLITLTVMKIYCHKHYEECTLHPRRYMSRPLMKEMTQFAGWNLAGTMGGMVGNYGKVIVLNSFFGTLLNAAQGIATQLSGMLMVFSTNMMKALNPVIVKNEGMGNHQEMLAYAMSGCKFSFMLFALLCLPCMVETPFILERWLGQYPDWTVVFVRFQLVLSLLEQTVLAMGTSLNATGKIKESSLISLILGLSTLPLLYIAFKMDPSVRWYFLIVFLCLVFLKLCANLYYIRKYCQLKIGQYMCNVLFPCLGLGAVTLIAGAFIAEGMSYGWLRFGAVTIVMTTVLVTMACLVMNAREKSVVCRLIAKATSCLKMR